MDRKNEDRMKPLNKIKILTQAYYRAKKDETFYWRKCSWEEKLNLIQTYAYIITVEISMNTHCEDLDWETIQEIRKMTWDEWETVWDDLYKNIPDPTDEFIKNKIVEKINK